MQYLFLIIPDNGSIRDFGQGRKLIRIREQFLTMTGQIEIMHEDKKLV
jgi:hypothetical protein